MKTPGKFEAPTLKHRACAQKLYSVTSRYIPYHPRAPPDCFVTIVCLFPFIFKRGVVHHGRRSAQIPRLRIKNRKVSKNDPGKLHDSFFPRNGQITSPYYNVSHIQNLMLSASAWEMCHVRLLVAGGPLGSLRALSKSGGSLLGGSI